MNEPRENRRAPDRGAMPAAPAPGRTRWIGPFLVVALIGVFMVASPMRYGEKNSGRYLLPVLRAMDGELFHDDPVVEALDTLGSLFYEGAEVSLRFFATSPDDLEPSWRVLYGISRVLLPLVLLVLARSLTTDLWFFVFLSAWAAHPKGAYMGGEKLFAAMLRHNEVAIPLCLLCLALLLRGSTFTAWAGLGLAVLVHPLIGYQLAFALLPAVLWHRGIDRRLLGGLAAFGACILYYLSFLSPPPLTGAEEEMFWLMKGGSGHFSLLSQTFFGWAKTGAVMAVAWLGTRHLAPREEGPELVATSMILASFAGVGLAIVIMLTDSLWLARVQPMRFFVWVTFLAHFLIAFQAAVAFRRRQAVAPALVAIVTFSIIDSLWFLSFTLLALAYFVVRRLELGDPGIAEAVIRWVTGAHLGLVAAVWALGQRQPFEGFRDPANLLPVVLLLPLLVLSSSRRRDQVLVGLLVVSSLAMASARLFYEREERRQPAWEEIGHWVRQNVPKDARFVLAPPGPGNFRFLTHRTPVSEPMPTLAWIAPFTHIDAQRIADEAGSCQTDGSWDLEALCRLGAELGAGYVVVTGPAHPAWEALFRSAEIRVFACPPRFHSAAVGRARETSSQL